MVVCSGSVLHVARSIVRQQLVVGTKEAVGSRGCTSYYIVVLTLLSLKTVHHTVLSLEAVHHVILSVETIHHTVLALY